MGSESMNHCQLLKYANRLKRERRLDEAIALYQEAIRLNPNFYYFYILLSDSLLKKRKYEEAIRLLHHACSLNPHSQWSHYMLGWTYFKIGSLDQAKVYLNLSLNVGYDSYIDRNCLNQLGLIESILNSRSITSPLGKPNQLSGMTQFNRYPQIFEDLQNYALGSSESSNDLKILSFGCSTGEECETLRQYFPNSLIFGCDVNSISLDKATRHNYCKRIKYINNQEDNILNYGQFDIILALSVLCFWPETSMTEDISDIYPFSQFDEVLLTLLDGLKPGGCFVLYNSNFFFEDSSIFDNFIAFDLDTSNNNGMVHKFGVDNKLLARRSFSQKEKMVFVRETGKSYSLKQSLWIKK